MAGRIPREFIDDILARADIVEIIDSRVRLKKAGKNYQACCPFHNEKSPSFTVAQDKQFYHCFGCGAHGNAISFLMEFDRLEFPEAVEELAQIMGLEVPREQGNKPEKTQAQKAQQANDYELMEQASRFYAHQLKAHPEKDKAVEYLKGRGLSGEVVKAFGIGYAPSGWDSLLGQFGKTPQLRQQMQELKLVNQNDNGRVYDFFRERIMFPIRDKRGRVIGFGGRVLGEGSPKYLNSPETRIFHKGYELYGLYQARQHNRKLERIVIVEGYMDVVALAQFDINYAVASLGTATTSEQLQTLFRSVPEVICCYDGDRAGRDAAWRAMENALPQLKDGTQMKFLFLPDGEDPDTMVRQIGKDAFEEKLKQGVPLSQFFFSSLLQKHQLGSAEGKAALKAEAVPLIEQIQGENQKAILLEELSKLLGEQNKYLLEQDMAAANRMSKMKTADTSLPNKSRISPIRMLLRLLLDTPQLATECDQVDLRALADLRISGMDLLQQVYGYCVATPNANTARLLEYFRDHPQAAQLGKLLLWEHDVRSENLQQVFIDSITKLIDWHFTSRMEELLAKSRVDKLSQAEKQELNLLMKEQKR